MVKANIATLAYRKAYSKVIHSIERGTDVNTVNKNGYSALHFAVKNSILSNIKYLVKKGINVNLKNNLGDTPLIGACACYRNDYDIVKFLVENGANINEKNNDNETPLLMACLTGKYDIAKLLIENGASVIKFIDATYNLDIMKLLFEHGSKIKSKALSDIMNNSWGYYLNDFERIKFLVEHGANVNSTCKYGKPILHYYMRKLIELKKIYEEKILDIENYTNIVKYLIGKGVNIDLLSGEDKYHFYSRSSWKSYTFTGDDLKQEAMKYYEEVMIEKCKERSDLLKEELIAKYHSPENIEKWAAALNKPFYEVIEVM